MRYLKMKYNELFLKKLFRKQNSKQCFQDKTVQTLLMTLPLLEI